MKLFKIQMKRLMLYLFALNIVSEIKSNSSYFNKNNDFKNLGNMKITLISVLKSIFKFY